MIIIKWEAMKSKLAIPIQRALRKLGHDISEARRRRRITTELMAERAGLTRVTLSKIEKGAETVSISGYARVLFILGMVDRLKDLADLSHDAIGRELDAENLPKRVRLPQADKHKREKDE